MRIAGDTYTCEKCGDFRLYPLLQVPSNGIAIQWKAISRVTLSFSLIYARLAAPPKRRSVPFETVSLLSECKAMMVSMSLAISRRPHGY